MKILVLGAGAIGGYYGARLIEAGADVTFLVRPRRNQQLREHGLEVESGVGAFARPVTSVTDVTMDDRFDLVLLTCKAYDLEGAADAIRPAMEAGAKVLPFLNGLGAYDYLDRRFGKHNVLGGVAYIATTMMDDGVIRHLADSDTMIVGARDAGSRDVAEAFFALARQTPGKRDYSDQIEQALWNKWVLLAAGAAACCLLRGTLREILRTDSGEKLISQAIDECAGVAAASGFPLSPESLAWVRGYLIAPESHWAASMMRDIAQDRPRLEADAIVGDMLSRAMALSVPARFLDSAYSHLQVYMQRQAGLAG